MPEPIVGGLADYPEYADHFGIRGQSVYTALFHHSDMETFACKICTHTVLDDFEAAIIHQRVHHFGGLVPNGTYLLPLPYGYD
jgi:hypothetical protein